MFTDLSPKGRKAIAIVPELPSREQPGSECKRLWMLKKGCVKPEVGGCEYHSEEEFLARLEN